MSAATNTSTSATDSQRQAELPAFKVIYSDGTSYTTSMAAGVTLTDARAYFVGRKFEQYDGSSKCVYAVECYDKPTCLHLKGKI